MVVVVTVSYTQKNQQKNRIYLSLIAQQFYLAFKKFNIPRFRLPWPESTVIANQLYISDWNIFASEP